MRKRFNPNALCSSENYAQSKKAHKEFLERTHDERMKSISMMSFSFENPKVTPWAKAYIQVFGKKMYLERGDVQRAMDAGYQIHYEY